MSANTVFVSESSVQVAGLLISRKEVADYLRRFAEEEREGKLLRAIEVGVFCLERASAAQDMEFVRHRIELMLNEVRTAVGAIPQHTETALLGKIGVNDGQVLAPIK